MARTTAPLPVITEENQPFWDGTRAGRLLMQRCAACAHIRYPNSAVCPRCLDGAYDWTELSGRGEVFSFTIFHRAYHPAWADRVPYNVALIQLTEGPRMFSNVVGLVGSEPIRVGMAVRVVFEAVADSDIVIPQFVVDPA